MRNFDADIQAIRGITSVVDAATALVNSIAARISAAVDAFKAANPDADVTELEAVIADAKEHAETLAVAVANNTPAIVAATPTGIAPGSGEESTGQPQGQGTSGGAEDQTHDQAPTTEPQA